MPPGTQATKRHREPLWRCAAQPSTATTATSDPAAPIYNELPRCAPGHVDVSLIWTVVIAEGSFFWAVALYNTRRAATPQ